MKKKILALAAAAATLVAIPGAAVYAQPGPDRHDDRGHDDRGPGRGDHDRGPGDRGPGNWRVGDRGPGGPGADYRNGRPGGRVYDARGYYRDPRPIGRDTHVWRGRGGHYYCRRDNGTTGLLVGAGVGALAGSNIAGNGDRTLGAVLGGVLGGALGQSIDRGDIRCR